MSWPTSDPRSSPGADQAAARIGGIPGFEVPERGPWFCEFLVRGPLPASELHAALAARGIAVRCILTAGGDSPGLNAAIRGFGKAAIGVHGEVSATSGPTAARACAQWF